MTMQRRVLETAPDPDSPNRTIRRQRVFDPLRRLLDAGLISQPHWVAAERFRDCYALAEGAREGTGGRLEAWQRCHYAAKVADARQEVRGSLQAVGLILSQVFVASVIQQMPIRQMERELRLKRDSGPDRIAEALDRLALWQAKAA
jgi:hypothetical protein